MKFWDIFKKSKVNPTFVPSNPSPIHLSFPDDQFFWREDNVLTHLFVVYGDRYDSDTGLGEVSDLHWSAVFPKIARKVKVRTTTGWPSPQKINLIIDNHEGVSVGLTGRGDLRFMVSTNLRKEILDNESAIRTRELFQELVLSKVSQWVTEVDPATLGIISESIILKCNNLYYYNLSAWCDFPCEHLLTLGYYDFKYGDDLNEEQ